mmetsp:Transcript_70839/g.223769  ORF Transcript_70839/g.223769 Transcript_70839/m.223769 type:complete len:244 (-) Transcript_70839:205-936(-)
MSQHLHLLNLGLHVLEPGPCCSSGLLRYVLLPRPLPAHQAGGALRSRPELAQLVVAVAQPATADQHELPSVEAVVPGGEDLPQKPQVRHQPARQVAEAVAVLGVAALSELPPAERTQAEGSLGLRPFVGAERQHVTVHALGVDDAHAARAEAAVHVQPVDGVLHRRERAHVQERSLAFEAVLLPLGAEEGGRRDRPPLGVLLCLCLRPPEPGDRVSCALAVDLAREDARRNLEAHGPASLLRR